MNSLLKTGLAVGGAAVAIKALRRASCGPSATMRLSPREAGGWPPQAQAAVQEGRVAARNVLATIDGKEDRLENSSTGPLDSSWSWEAASPSTM
jgi:hypothetical protein